LNAYYNENDPHAAAWLRNLIASGHIAAGDVDDRSIADVRADELGQYTQHHFFAGIAGWSLALRLAGWPDDRPVWTGSCPCQPFSTAGKGKGADDERHLWPHWFRLIRECRPAIIFGEQVAAAIGWGWLDALFADLEGEGYATGAAVLPACSVGAPHIRQRVWFVADNGSARLEIGRLEQAWGECAAVERIGGAGELGNADSERSVRYAKTGRQEGDRAQLGSLWSDCIWLPCTDGKARPTQSPLLGMADGLPDGMGYVRTEGRAFISPLITGASSRVGRLRGYGNAIVPQVAAAFIRASVF
jgi:DNA (cytosine-5)-methyltransferase 1